MNNILSCLEGVRTVIIAGHTRPDGDCVGACMGLWHYLRDNYPEIEADVRLEPVPESYKVIAGVEQIIGSYEDDKVYDLFIALDASDKGRLAGCTSPQDMDKLKLSLQGYNYGNGYITWAIRKYGGYSAENALQFSNEQAASHGWSAYGDPEYVPHVLRYYSSGGLFAGLFGGNGQIVSVALTQLGNEGGQKFWSWYGFDSHVAWCACFASWCGDQAGLIESGKMPKFSLCDDGIAWFQSKGKWKSRGYSPAPGTLIFFDWNGDGTSDHVGIVEKTEGSTVYTVEGNSSNAVNQRSYDINNGTIMGYGIL